MGEFSLPRIPGMRHPVDLAESGRIHIPSIALHRDGMLQPGAGLGAPVPTPFPLRSLLFAFRRRSICRALMPNRGFSIAGGIR